ncbi:MAG TPA: cytochrome c oxidase assembly protein [Candidatus Deferrimicrobiaceae bacterium]|nr:cytochrome c oxidase assembly protein [Candidatus Deferrimicrobiaceae bacterium]
MIVAGLTAVAWAIVAQPALAHGRAPADAPDLAALVMGWTLEPLVAAGILVAAVAWLALLRRIARFHPERPVSRWRTAAFFGGLAAIAIALMSGIEAYDTTLFSVHMVQHMLLTFAAAPLLVLAAPVTQLLRAATPEARQRWLLPVLHSGPVAVLGHPVVAWLAFTVVMWATHFSPLFNLALEEPLTHDLEHALFLGSALMFWWPVVGADPGPRRMGHAARGLYLLLQMPPNSFLAVAILLATAPLYPHYATLGSPYGIDALADQQLAAGLMWVVSDLVLIGAILLVIAGWMRKEERDAPAAERRADRERQRLSERADELAARVGQAGDTSAGSGEASRAR